VAALLQVRWLLLPARQAGGTSSFLNATFTTSRPVPLLPRSKANLIQRTTFQAVSPEEFHQKMADTSS